MTTSISDLPNLKSATLRISSKLRQGGTSTDFKINVTGTTKPIQGCRGVLVKSVSFPNVFYNVTEANQEFKMLWEQAPANLHELISIPPVGYYKIDELIAWLATDLSLNTVGDIVIVKDEQTNRLTFSIINETGLIQLLGPADNDMADILGITVLDENKGLVTTVTTTNAYDMRSVTDVYIVSNTLSDYSNYISAGDGRQNGILTNIPITTAYGCTEVYEPEMFENNAIAYPRDKSIQSIDIKLEDQDGKEIDLQGLDIEIVLRIFF